MDSKNSSIVILEIPKQDILTETTNTMARLSKEYLQGIIKLYRHAFSGKQIMLRDSYGKVSPAPDDFIPQPSDKKDTMVQCMAFFYASSHNSYMFYANASKGIREIILMVAESYFVDAQKMNALYPKLVPKPSSNYFYDKVSELSTIPELNQSSKVIGYYKSYTFLYSIGVLKGAKAYFAEKVAAMHPVAILPDSGLNVYNNEKGVFDALLLLRLLYDNSVIGPSYNPPKVTTIKKAARSLNLNEFFSDIPKDEKVVDHLAARQLISAYTAGLLYSKNLRDDKLAPRDIIRLIADFKAPSLNISDILMPHIKTKGTAWNYAPARNLVDAVRNTLSSFEHIGEWEDFDRFRLRLRTYENVMPLIGIPSPVDSNLVYLNKKSGETEIYAYQIYNHITIPMIQGYLFTLAALGVIEIAYTNYDPNSVSYTDAIRYIRLTTLGKYAFGITDTYTEPAAKHNNDFTTADDELIIRSDSETNPVLDTILEFAKPIAKNRYRVTTASFLEACSGQKQLEDRIRFFHTFINPSPPAIWQEFFKSLRQHCRKLNICQTVYKTYIIDPADLELQRAVSTDPEIRKISLRAENHVLLVESKSLPLFKTLLKRHGFLTE